MLAAYLFGLLSASVFYALWKGQPGGWFARWLKSFFVRRYKSQRGSAFVILFGGVAMLGSLGYGMSQFIRGPLATTVTISRVATAETQMQMAMRMAVVQAALDIGDCDEDGFIVPIAPRDPDSAQHPIGGGSLPVALGMPLSDPWGTPYGYCAWKHGPGDGAGCDPVNLAGLREGAGDPALVPLLPVISVISAGPSRQFSTSCADFNPLQPDDALVVKGSDSDDVILTSNYTEASSMGGGLWRLKEGDPDTATIAKAVEIEGAFRMGLAGDGAGQVSATACSEPTHAGRMRYDEFMRQIEVCAYDDGLYFWTPISGQGGDDDGIGMFDAIFTDEINRRNADEITVRDRTVFLGDRVGIGLTNPQARLDVAGNINVQAGPGRDRIGGGAIVLQRSEDTANPARLVLQKSRGTVEAPSPVEPGDLIGSITFNAYRNDAFQGSDAPSSALIRAQVTGPIDGDSVPASLIFRTTGPGEVFGSDRMRIDHAGNVGIGASQPTTRLDVRGSIRIGDGNEACEAETEGTLRYVSVTNNIELCNGSAWAMITGNGATGGASIPIADPASCTLGDHMRWIWDGDEAVLTCEDSCLVDPPGAQCKDGAIYMGIIGGNRVYVAPADEPTTFAWGPWGTTNADSHTDGLANTSWLAAQGTPYPAALACATKIPEGTWYLPAQDELNLLWRNVAYIPNFIGGTIYNWSSTQGASTSNAQAQRLDNGTAGSLTRSNQARVRCVRR